jgi:DTW domain-containing protein YfiP
MRRGEDQTGRINDEMPGPVATDSATPREHRAFCYRCLKAANVCVCASIPQVDNTVPIIIFQHPRERNHPVGTARFARLGLRRVSIESAQGAGTRGITREVDLPPHTALLFPSSDAVLLDAMDADERPKALVVLDGTWSTAAKVFADNPWLHRLPRVALRPEAPGNYRIRKEPRAECLSTIESIVMALKILEPANDTSIRQEKLAQLDELLAAFSQMVDVQIEHAKQSNPRKRRPRWRRPAVEGLPSAFREAHARTIVLYAELTLQDEHQRSKQRDLICLAALRPSDGQQFMANLQREKPLGAKLREHLDFPDNWQDSALSAEALRDAWSAFAGADPILVAWSKSNLDALAEVLGAKLEGVVLKGIVGNLDRKAPGAMEPSLQKYGLIADPIGLPGRAGKRLSQTLALYRWIRGQVIAHASDRGE